MLTDDDTPFGFHTKIPHPDDTDDDAAQVCEIAMNMLLREVASELEDEANHFSSFETEVAARIANVLYQLGKRYREAEMTVREIPAQKKKD